MKVKWLQLSNLDDTATSKQHGYIAKECKERWTGEKYPGNQALCAVGMVSDDGEYATDFDKIEDAEILDQDKVCKRCLKIFLTS